jgi:hypothetical protein
MLNRKVLTAGVAALAMAASSTVALAQATGTENNATTGSRAGSGPNSGAEMKGAPGSTGMQGSSGSTSSDSMKHEKPTSAGTSENQAKDLRGHSETPTTGK